MSLHIRIGNVERSLEEARRYPNPDDRCPVCGESYGNYNNMIRWLYRGDRLIIHKTCIKVVKGVGE